MWLIKVPDGEQKQERNILSRKDGVNPFHCFVFLACVHLVKLIVRIHLQNVHFTTSPCRDKDVPFIYLPKCCINPPIKMAVYVCESENCVEAFSSLKAAKKHFTDNHKEHKIKCSACSRSFSRRNGLRSHLESEHGMPIIKPVIEWCKDDEGNYNFKCSLVFADYKKIIQIF